MTLDVQSLPAPLAEQAQSAWQNILERAADPAALERAAAAQPVCGQLPRMLACSRFVAEYGRGQPQAFLELLTDTALQQPLSAQALHASLRDALAAEGAELQPVLRRFRQRQMVRILWRDFCRLADTLETIGETSALADACIREALPRVQAGLEERFGQPTGRRSGQPQQLIVIAMGKLGAGELNVSSDIDLVFAYPEAGETSGGRRCISNEEFFTRVGQGLIAALDQQTADGFVFRVDMRLRPYGESGALVHSFAALDEYYQQQGRDWERYALIKARPVTGEPARVAELMQSLRPFVYRRYVDFSVIESLRSMKQMISAEVRRRGLQDNVKLGHGGIREVEFIAQCFQLIRGGRDLALQQRELLVVLEECVALGCLPRAAVDELRAAYLFLRDSEHAIQGYQDRQTQELPVDDVPRAAMALVMGCADWTAYRTTLDAQLQVVAGHFDALIAPPEEEADSGAAEDDADLLWGEHLESAALAALGYADAGRACESLRALHDSPRVVALQAEGRQRLDQFMPQLVRACAAESAAPDLALQRLLPLVVAVARRSAYLVLLLENPPALDELVRLCGDSPWIAEQMSRHPALLDELLDRASLYRAPGRDELRSLLSQEVARLATDDLEAQMDALRYFKAAQVLRVAASEIAGRLPVMKVSDNLTWIAEVVLEQVLAVAWADLTRKYGEPAREDGGYAFAVFGYGKLGGIELGYGSDLDLVFVHDAAAQGSTDGGRSIANAVFYTRLAQRMIHILEARMPLGQLYEVDMRLRPDGDSGVLVPGVEGFARYQRDNAWTWEHQALVRARHVAGDRQVAGRVEDLRREILCRERDTAALADEVVAMRRRMREHLLPREAPERFHLKQGSGGIVDIEFMAQYAVLAWSHAHPQLAQWPDNVRILEALGEAGLLPQATADALREAYLAYRGAAHQLALQRESGEVDAALFATQRDQVRAAWRSLFAED
ncbi:bifunctional [glutamate--ammonia ligase]-adenylyl-L-tyrosine phosphorylase/[glutamate--ammonia-ligase] adenylyltransferase [Mangrovimicrobium sediminis]|uniref:Bifunctional glutamine synthetase adenylyltransferase/adenylyl-removing enzyme n=1 Tax=Mangrovimicrobium sediminis TaxID=2562682 RepID=A0A4Z0M086_9GAMM|nr:bifunctional [glutamate--ammonia ligase]-adenylyl-L-tyrosine phosphorylase/[glutamate--ammonia-ligase] adenylyltransferase [Haliea sp. SAOS-164]TGD72941.1 bifunctional [glutamate--ammonia ligase]-adenylyl-L-tyrosine phosphorylase/[glutamate--ammonia-ligase] adenylyltransferase [Haliea sp. SAOS-164]